MQRRSPTCAEPGIWNTHTWKESLPLNGVLAADLARGFEGACTGYTGINATKEAFLKNVAPRLNAYGKVVFATHGYAGPALPGIQEPVLLFSLVPPGADGYLRMSEVMGLKMNADMVALTACETGLGKQLPCERVIAVLESIAIAKSFNQIAGTNRARLAFKSDITFGNDYKRFCIGQTKFGSNKTCAPKHNKQGCEWHFTNPLGSNHERNPSAVLQPEPTLGWRVWAPVPLSCSRKNVVGSRFNK